MNVRKPSKTKLLQSINALRSKLQGKLTHAGKDGESGGIEVEGELLVAGGASMLDLSHCIASSLTQAMGFEPAFHPDMAVLWLPDLDQFESATTTRAEERIIAETGFDALAPGDVLSSCEQGLDIEEGELEAEGFQSGDEGGCDLMFDVAGIEAGVAHHLHALEELKKCLPGGLTDNIGEAHMTAERRERG